MSAALLIAIGVFVDQASQHGLTRRVLYAAIPLVLGVAVRSVVANRRTVAQLVRGTARAPDNNWP